MWLSVWNVTRWNLFVNPNKVATAQLPLTMSLLVGENKSISMINEWIASGYYGCDHLTGETYDSVVGSSITIHTYSESECFLHEILVFREYCEKLMGFGGQAYHWQMYYCSGRHSLSVAVLYQQPSWYWMPSWQKLFESYNVDIQNTGLIPLWNAYIYGRHEWNMLAWVIIRWKKLVFLLCSTHKFTSNTVRREWRDGDWIPFNFYVFSSSACVSVCICIKSTLCLYSIFPLCTDALTKLQQRFIPSSEPMNVWSAFFCGKINGHRSR